MERLPWQRDGEDFIAHPEGDETEPFARIRFDPDANEAARWIWTVEYPKWFSAHGRTGDRQTAANEATRAWWHGKTRPIPRDIAGEVAAIMAIIETEPLRGDLIHDEYPFLYALMHAIRTKYFDLGLNPPPPPPMVRKVVSDLSNEFFRRRTSGEL
ncbi:MAG TPA: hypothetical protein VGN79_12485 [Devosia sp.]|jgi:hypothetical protein|nr:hypothetical protein [Devosia sp.]